MNHIKRHKGNHKNESNVKEHAHKAMLYRMILWLSPKLQQLQHPRKSRKSQPAAKKRRAHGRNHGCNRHRNKRKTTMRRLWVTPVVLSLVLVLLYCSIAPVDYTPHSDVSWHIDSKSNGTIHSAFGQKPHANAFCMAFCASADAGEHRLHSKNSSNVGANSGCMVTLFLKLSLTLTLTHAI